MILCMQGQWLACMSECVYVCEKERRGTSLVRQPLHKERETWMSYLSPMEAIAFSLEYKVQAGYARAN